jgi:uncharacterized protein (TIGR03083 family)
VRPAAELLQLEAAALPPLLRGTPEPAFDGPTVLPGWSVRDVIAHCGAALGRLVTDELGRFTPEENHGDVESRRSWPLEALLDDLFSRYPEAVTRIDELDGAADAIGLGEWIHGGDIRDAIGAPDAYTSDGIEIALSLIAERAGERGIPATVVDLDDRRLGLGMGPPVGRLRCDTETFVRLVAGREADPARYDLTGLEPTNLLLFS